MIFQDSRINVLKTVPNSKFRVLSYDEAEKNASINFKASSHYIMICRWQAVK
jgi:translation initiation factor IF-1